MAIAKHTTLNTGYKTATEVYWSHILTSQERRILHHEGHTKIALRIV